MGNSRVFERLVVMLVVAFAVTDSGHASVYSDAVLADGPIHYYRFEEADTTLPASDEVGGQVGSYMGGVAVGSPSAFASLGNAALFDGAGGSFVDLGTPFHPGNTISVEAWAYLSPTSTATFAPIVARWDGSYELDFNANTGRANFVTRNFANDFGLAESGPFANSTWHHLVGIFENGITTIWVDGVQGTTNDTSGGSTDLQDAGATLLIGSTRDGTTFNWEGLIDEVAFYSYALADSQIRAHIAAATVPTNPIPEPTTFAVWSVLGLIGATGWRRRRRS